VGKNETVLSKSQVVQMVQYRNQAEYLRITAEKAPLERRITLLRLAEVLEGMALSLAGPRSAK